MSELSLFIQNQNEVQIDESYMQRCKADNQKQPSRHISTVSRMLSSKELKLNRSYLAKKKSLSPYAVQSKAHSGSALNSRLQNGGKDLSRIATRLEAMQENQKRMEERLGKEFFDMQNQIFKKQKEQSDQFEEVHQMRQHLHSTKRAIGELLNTISRTDDKL